MHQKRKQHQSLILVLSGHISVLAKTQFIMQKKNSLIDYPGVIAIIMLPKLKKKKKKNIQKIIFPPRNLPGLKERHRRLFGKRQ